VYVDPDLTLLFIWTGISSPHWYWRDLGGIQSEKYSRWCRNSCYDVWILEF